ncbi:MAG: hypothetical protein DDT37_01640 [Firmicutes bacterium]|nr:hypothetical protein [candidate division NPL-UPA2 bacterium]
MTNFTDSKDSLWQVEITIGTLRRVQRLMKPQYGEVDLGEPLGGTPPLMTRFDMDIRFKVDLLWSVLEPQLVAAGIDDLAFAERLTGRALFDASEAFMEAWSDFFRCLRRLDHVAAIEKEQEQVAKIWAKGEELIRSEALQASLDEDLAELGDSVLNSLRSPGARTSSPAPSAS